MPAIRQLHGITTDLNLPKSSEANFFASLTLTGLGEIHVVIIMDSCTMYSRLEGSWTFSLSDLMDVNYSASTRP